MSVPPRIDPSWTRSLTSSQNHKTAAAGQTDPVNHQPELGAP